MTYGTVITKARELARTSTGGFSDARALVITSEAILDFCRDIGGFRFVRKLEITGTFIAEEFEGFHLEIVGSTNNDVDADIAATSSATGSRLTGTEMAALLQVQIRAEIGAGADLTVTWANFAFTVSGIDSTTIEISAPDSDETYIDATSKYFGGCDDGVLSIESDFPEGCTVGAPLESNFREELSVMWERNQLCETTEASFQNPSATGSPAYYYIDNWGYILLLPSPTTQKNLSISYQGPPTLVASPTTSTVIPAAIPEEYHPYIAYRVAETFLLGSFEDKLADRRRAEYERGVNRYNVRKANRNTEARAGVQASTVPYYVVGS